MKSLRLGVCTLTYDAETARIDTAVGEREWVEGKRGLRLGLPLLVAEAGGEGAAGELGVTRAAQAEIVVQTDAERRRGAEVG